MVVEELGCGWEHGRLLIPIRGRSRELRGVLRYGTGAVTHSIVMRSKSGTVRYVEARHNFVTKTWSPD